MGAWFPVRLGFLAWALLTGSCGFTQPEMLQCRESWMEPQFCDVNGWNESSPLNPK